MEAVKSQKILAVLERLRREAMRFHETRQALPDRFIVVDDRNYNIFWHVIVSIFMSDTIYAAQRPLAIALASGSIIIETDR